MIEHGGSGAGYVRGCRCDVCTQANTDRCRARRDERLAARVEVNGRLVVVDETQVENHGKRSTYMNWGCRCVPCTDSNTVATNARHAKARMSA